MSEKTTLRVKSVLGPNTIIAGLETFEYDKIYYILNEKLFKHILYGNLYIDNTFLYEVISIKKVWNYILKRMDNILNELRKDPYIRNDPDYIKYIDKVEHAIITGLFLQELENIAYTKNQIRKILLENEALAYVSLYKYLKSYINEPIRIPIIAHDNKEKESIETILRIYKVVSKYNLAKLKDLRDLYHEIIRAITDIDYIDVKKELEMIKKYTIINKKAKLRKKIIRLKKEKEEIEKQIEILKKVNPSNPEIKELEKEKEEIEKELQKLAKRKEIIKKDVQNGKEKAKTKSKELENKNE